MSTEISFFRENNCHLNTHTQYTKTHGCILVPLVHAPCPFGAKEKHKQVPEHVIRDTLAQFWM